MHSKQRAHTYTEHVVPHDQVHMTPALCTWHCREQRAVQDLNSSADTATMDTTHQGKRISMISTWFHNLMQGVVGLYRGHTHRGNIKYHVRQLSYDIHN